MGSRGLLTLNINIIGAGVAGLACALALKRKGHNVTVYEQSKELSEFGAGIQIFSNATRIIYAWGLQDAFLKVVNQPSVMSVRRYSNDEVIGEIAHNPISEWEYGFPHWQAHRGDWQSLIAKAAIDAGVEIRFGTAVDSIDPDSGTMTILESGQTVVADLIVGADGIRSHSRKALSDVEPQAYKEDCFRALIPKSKMLEDRETAELMAGHLSYAWVGPGRAVLGYPVSSGESYNILLSVVRPSQAEVGKWNQPGDLAEVQEHLRDWCSVVKKAWSLVDGCVKWTLGDVPPIPSYVSESGKFVLVGDAAHAIVPHAGQGGAMALEDAAALAEFLDPGSLTSYSELPQRMKAFSDFRRARLENVRRIAYGNANFLTMNNGPEQEQRDKMWAGMTAKWKEEVAELGEKGYRERARTVVPDPDVQDMRTPEGRMYLNGFDVVAEAKKVVEDLAER